MVASKVEPEGMEGRSIAQSILDAEFANSPTANDDSARRAPPRILFAARPSRAWVP